MVFTLGTLGIATGEALLWEVLMTSGKVLISDGAVASKLVYRRP